MAIRQPVAYQAGAFNPALLRAYETLPWLQDPAAGVVKPLSGVIPRGSGLDWQISQSGSTVTVGVGAAVVAGTEAAAQAGYEAINDAAMSFAIPAASTSQTRRDRIGLRVRDSAYSGTAADGDLVLVQGTAASANPQLPAAPANFYEIAQVSTAGAGTPSVTPTWRYTGGVSGIRPSRGGTVDDGLAPMFAGQYRDRDGLERGTGPGGVWEPIAKTAVWTQWTPKLYARGSGTDTEVALGSGGSAVGRYLVQGKACHLRIVIRGGPGFNNGGYGQFTTRLPPGVKSATTEESQIFAKVNTVNVNGNKALTGIWPGCAYIPPDSTEVQPHFPLGYDDCRLGAFRAASSQGAAGTGVPRIVNSGSFPDLGILTIQGTIEIQ